MFGTAVAYRLVVCVCIGEEGFQGKKSFHSLLYRTLL